MNHITDPPHILDWLLWPLLRGIWEPVSRKRSHFWQWKRFEQTVPEVFYERVDPDASARPCDGWWTTFWNLNFGWGKVAIFQPPIDGQRYRIGFVDRASGLGKMVCTQVMQGSCAMLIGPHHVDFFAVEHPGRELVPLRLVRVTVKSQLEKGIPLL